MQLEILKAFKAEDSPRPFLPGDFVTVSDATGKDWIAQGRAIQPPTAPASVPQRRQREKAVTA